MLKCMDCSAVIVCCGRNAVCVLVRVGLFNAMEEMIRLAALFEAQMKDLCGMGRKGAQIGPQQACRLQIILAARNMINASLTKQRLAA